MSVRKTAAGDGPYPLPEGWRWAKLGDVAEINPRDPKPADDTEISFVGMAQLDATAASAKPLETRPFSEVSKGYTVFRNHDVLVAKITPCWENGKIGQAELDHEVGVGSTEFHVVRPGDRLDRRYILHFLRQSHVRDTGELRMTGSAGQRRVPAKYLSDLQVPLAPLAEQRRISRMIDDLRKVLSWSRAELKKLSDFPACLFIDKFGDPNKLINQIQLGDIADFISGKNLLAEDQESLSPYQVLKIGSVSTGTFDSKQVKKLPSDYIPEDRHIVRKGDLLMSRINTEELVGAAAYVYECPPNISFPDGVRKFIWKDPGQEPEFYSILLSLPAMRRKVSQLSSGTAGSMKNISSSKLKKLKIPLISTIEQAEFLESVHVVNDLKNVIREREYLLSTLLLSLQSRAFRGEL